MDFNRNDSHRKIRTQLLKANVDIIPIKISENLSEQQALSLESKLIDILGLKSLSNNGLLVNLDEGVYPIQRRKLYPEKFKKLLSNLGYKLN